MKTPALVLLGALALSAGAQNLELIPVPKTPPRNPLDRPGSTSLAPPAPKSHRINPTPVPATPAPGPVAGTVLQRTATGLLVQTRIPGDRGLVWLTGVDVKAGLRVEVVARPTAPVSCPTAFGDRMLDGYQAATQ